MPERKCRSRWTRNSTRVQPISSSVWADFVARFKALQIRLRNTDRSRKFKSSWRRFICHSRSAFRAFSGSLALTRALERRLSSFLRSRFLLAQAFCLQRRSSAVSGWLLCHARFCSRTFSGFWRALNALLFSRTVSRFRVFQSRDFARAFSGCARFHSIATKDRRARLNAVLSSGPKRQTKMTCWISVSIRCLHGH